MPDRQAVARRRCLGAVTDDLLISRHHDAETCVEWASIKQAHPKLARVGAGRRWSSGRQSRITAVTQARVANVAAILICAASHPVQTLLALGVVPLATEIVQ